MTKDAMTRIGTNEKLVLQVLSNMRKQTQVSLLNAMVLDAMEQLKQQHPELLPVIQMQMKQGE